MADFASLANMTVRSFQRRFKAEFSCTAQEWLIARRAENILNELRSTNKDLTTIAMQYGFSAMSYFTTFCKRHFGMPPSAIRSMRDTKHGAKPVSGPVRIAPDATASRICALRRVK